jgi:hypothetical protein
MARAGRANPSTKTQIRGERSLPSVHANTRYLVKGSGRVRATRSRVRTILEEVQRFSSNFNKLDVLCGGRRVGGAGCITILATEPHTIMANSRRNLC